MIFSFTCPFLLSVLSLSSVACEGLSLSQFSSLDQITQIQKRNTNYYFFVIFLDTFFKLFCYRPVKTIFLVYWCVYSFLIVWVCVACGEESERMYLVWITVAFFLFYKCVECSGTGKTLIIYVILMQWPVVTTFWWSLLLNTDKNTYLLFDASVTFNCYIIKLP